MVNAVLAESIPLTVGDQGGVDSRGIWRSCLIAADVEGSSGYYPAEVLRRDGATAFPAGTHVYLDHPKESDEKERPERSVRDLAGYLVDEASFEEGQDGRGLFARIQFTEEIKDRIRALAPVVGLSIRANGEIEKGPNGRKIVRSVKEGLSVDVVTRAGAGGRLVTMSESSKSESPPASTPSSGTEEGNIPSTIGSGSLVSEVAALKESFADRMQEANVEVARLAQQIRESHRDIEKVLQNNRSMTETITFLRERQEATDAKIAESKGNGDRLKEILGSGLPVASMMRVAESCGLSDDVHERIQTEREYGKRLMRESERGALSSRPESSLGLGLTESVLGDEDNGNALSSASKEDISEVESVLTGKIF